MIDFSEIESIIYKSPQYTYKIGLALEFLDSEEILDRLINLGELGFYFFLYAYNYSDANLTRVFGYLDDVSINFVKKHRDKFNIQGRRLIREI